MKCNILCTLSLLVIITIQAFAQKTWVPFLQQTKANPITNLSVSNNAIVSFTIQIGGMETSNMNTDTSAYQVLSIPEGTVVTKEGSPKVPMITKLIAIPDCDNVSISVAPSNQIEFSNYRVAPAPRHERKYSPDGSYIIADIYDEDKSIYSSDSFFPGKYGEIIETGYVRSQKVAKVAIYPIQYNPVSKKIRAFTNFNVTLSFVNPKSAVNKELGIFQKMMHHVALNYIPDSLNASTKNIGTTKSNALSKASPNTVASGSVTRVTDLSTLVGTSAISVDYLIITHSSLFNSTSLTTLANHRRDYNGLDVAIVQLNSSFYSSYPGNGNHYQGIRDFIKDVYNLGKANHIGDGHLAYILLVGDAMLDDNSAEMVPAAYPPSSTPPYYTSLEQAGDYYYACTGGDNDDLQDVMYGRLPVGDETKLNTIVSKIVNYEANSNGNWQENYAFMSFSPEYYSEGDAAIRSMTNLIPSTCNKYYAYRALDTDPATTVTAVTLPILGKTFSNNAWLHGTPPLNSDDPNGLCYSQVVNDWLYNQLNNDGIHTFVYEGHGGWNALGANEGCGRYIFKSSTTYPPCGYDATNTIYSKLTNTFNTFMIFDCCDAGHFDNGTTNGGTNYDNCLSEKLIDSVTNKGAIGVLSSTRDSDTGAFGIVDGYVLQAQYQNLSHIMGEAVMESKLQMSSSQYRRQYNLYGDPALNLWPTGFTLTSNLTLTGANDISTNITVPAGVTLTIAAGSTLRISNGAKITVNGTLTANGGSSSTPIKFNFVSPNSTTQNGIVFNSGSSGTIAYCRIVNAYQGIYENSTSINISNSAIDSCTTGIYIYNTSASTPLIKSCYIHYNTYGISLLNSSPTIDSNYIQNNSTGVNCSTYSNPLIGSADTKGNDIEANNYGVFCYNNAAPVIGYTSPASGYNNLVNTTYNVYNMSSNSIYADYNWWGSTNTSLFKIAGTSGVATYGYLSSIKSMPTLPLSKSSASLNTTQGSDIPLLSVLNQAMQYAAAKNPDLAKAVCLTLINNFPDYSVSFNALNLLKDIYLANNADSAKNVFQSLFNNKSQKKLYAMAGLILADIDKDNKLQHLNDVINNYSKDSVVELALFDKFVYYHFEKNDKQNALAVLKQLDNSFPLSQGAIEAHQILGDSAYYNLDMSKKQALQSTVQQIPTKYALSNNYPNPFNPTTIIEYQLPKDGFVSLKIYDILGRVVRTLVNENKTVGIYSVSFDASKLASGVYIYQLRVNAGGTNNIVLTKKMQLLK